MNDKFEEYIRENRQKFDSREPDPASWDKLEKRLKPLSPARWKTALLRVAAVALIFLVSYAVNELIHQRRVKRAAAENATERKWEPDIPELREAEAYYSGLVSRKLEEVRMAVAGYPMVEEELQADFSRLDSIYLELKDDLKDNIASQEIIEAIIENYRLRIAILEDMLTELQPDESTNTKKNDGYDM